MRRCSHREARTPRLWKKITSNVNGSRYYATFDFCTGQCWYDQDVVTPKGQPDTVFVIGSYTYGELGGRSNARAVLRSTTAGEPDPANGDRTFTDMTLDAQVPAPYGIHPDQHELAFHPTNPNIWWSTSDGGVVRSSGEYVDISSQCAGRPIGAASMLTCNRLLSAVPSKIFSLNEGLMTLQFMSVSVNPFDPTGEVQGGTQDNGTWLYDGNAKVWKQTIYGDGGTSGFDVGNPAIRFNQFFGGFGDVNFRSGDPTAWVVVTAPMLNSGEAVGFYWPEIADPSVAGHDVHRLQARLADEGQRRRPDLPRGELSRVHDARRQGGVRRLGRAWRTWRHESARRSGVAPRLWRRSRGRHAGANCPCAL